MKNIILIGMPGCGKSTTGVLLAKSLCMPFIDTDLLIQSREGMPLQDIIDKRGLDAFLKAEETAILEGDFNGAVVATGGSAVYSAAAMDRLKKNGTVVYLKLPLRSIEKRLSNIKTRGVAMKKGQTLPALFAERTPLYERYADKTIDCAKMDIEQAVSAIIDALKNDMAG